MLLGLVLAAAEVCSRRLGCPRPTRAASGALSATECHAGRCKNPTGLQRNGQASTKCFAGAGPEPPAPRGLEPGAVPRSSQRAPFVCEAPREPVPCPHVDPSLQKCSHLRCRGLHDAEILLMACLPCTVPHPTGMMRASCRQQRSELEPDWTAVVIKAAFTKPCCSPGEHQKRATIPNIPSKRKQEPRRIRNLSQREEPCISH